MSDSVRFSILKLVLCGDSLSSLVEVKPEITTPAKAPRPSKDEDTGYDDISDGELDDLIVLAEEDKEDNQVRKPG